MPEKIQRPADRPEGDQAILLTSPYEPLYPWLEPECIYFYYLTGHHDVLAFVLNYGRLTTVELEAKIPDIVDDIRSGRLTPCGYNLGDVKWRRKSYFVGVLDDAESQLIPYAAFTFYRSADKQNYSFRDGRDIKRFGDVTGFYCINHMLTRDGNVNYGTPDDYVVRATHISPLHEDTGTNLGPPVPPP